MKKETKIGILAILGLIIATFNVVPYNNKPKIIQDLINILSSLNPLKHLYDIIKSMDEIDAIYDLLPGDHIYCHRSLGYTHHGIYAGNGEVWAYQGVNFHDVQVHKVTLHEFANGDRINKLIYTADYDVPTILTRAASRNAEHTYNIFNNNCMHYAYWCRLLDHNIDVTEKVFNTIIADRRG